MLVPSMTLEEIQKEIIKDYPNVEKQTTFFHSENLQ